MGSITSTFTKGIHRGFIHVVREHELGRWVCWPNRLPQSSTALQNSRVSVLRLSKAYPSQLRVLNLGFGEPWALVTHCGGLINS